MKKSNSALIALTTAAMLLPNLCKKAEANSLDQKTTFDYKYSNYQEGELAADKLGGGSPKRYEIDVHQFKFKTGISSDTEVSISGVQEAMSGASGWYIQPDENGKLLQVMSGATIDEKRSELGIDFHSIYGNTESSLSAGYSQENDYRSLSFGYSGAIHFNNNLTSLDYGINTSKDYIDATDADIYSSRPVDKIKNRLGLVIGASQVLTKNTLLGVSFSFAALDGFLSDSYKLALVDGIPVQDSRPDSNQQFAASLMWREFFPSANAALHADYRYYSNNWGLKSNTLELSWHQNIGKGWQLIPSLRQYQQTKVQFYQPYYEFKRADAYYSSDYRLSDFSATSGQLKLRKNFDSFYVDASYETYTATGDNPALISYAFLSLGGGVKF